MNSSPIPDYRLIHVSEAVNDIWTISSLSLEACANRSQPVTVSLLLVGNQLNASDAMEVENRMHHGLDVPDYVDEESAWK
jgi:hypothetical protein